MDNWEINLTGVEKTYKEQILKGIDTILQDFNFIKNIPIKISSQWNEKGNPSKVKVEIYNREYYYTIYLSEYYLKSEFGLSKLKETIDERFYSNFSSVIIHELGHILQDIYCSRAMFICKVFQSDVFYYKYIRSSSYEKIFLQLLKMKCYLQNKIFPFSYHNYLGKNASKSIYEFFADCFNTYYYLLGEDTASRKGTREYYAFKISESIINMIKNSF